MIPIFVGYDPKEAIVFHVCISSALRKSSLPLSFTPLSLNTLEGYVESHTDGSNEFIYSRFLVPSLMGFEGWAIYIDGDMLVREDIAQLWSLRDMGKAVMVVKHAYETKMKIKYLGAKNENYPRKNWSSVILWNCAHPANRQLTPGLVSGASGAQLHRFSWLEDDLIGELPAAWNWLPDEFGESQCAKLLHWTLGAPSFDEFANTPMAEEWHRERTIATHCRQREAN